MIEPLRELIALKKHMKAEQERNEEEERQRKDGTDTITDSSHHYGRGFAEAFTGTIPFDFKWTSPSVEKSKITGSLVSYQPFVPALNYSLDELISKPNEPEVLKKWKTVNDLEKL